MCVSDFFFFNAIEWLQEATGGKVAIFLELDLANLDSIRKKAEDFQTLAGTPRPSIGPGLMAHPQQSA
jgi:hypothetical protein